MRILFLLLALLILPLALSAQKSITAFRLNSPPIIDGIHEPALWAGADSAKNFTQMEPFAGAAASEPTVCYIGFDEENIYISNSVSGVGGSG